MKTISFTGWRRPSYEKQVLASIAKQPEIGEYAFFPCYDKPAPNNIGCDASIFKAVSQAFAAGSEFNLHVEDDTLLSPDALSLCNWFLDELENRDDYALLNLHAHSKDISNPLDMVESPKFNSWGWAITANNWYGKIVPEWNKKKIPPRGWDWSLSLIIQRHGLKTLRPKLSRVLNIGREGGTYESPAHYDSWLRDLVHSPGGFGNDFRIVERITNFPPLDDWAIRELEAEKKR